MQEKNLVELSKALNELYERYNRRDYVSPDPLQFLYHYTSSENIELAGIISSSFAFGNVKNIINFLDKIFYIISPPYDFIKNSSEKEILKTFKGMKYRFADDKEISSFFIALKRVYERYSSLYKMFMREYIKKKSILNATYFFLNKMRELSSNNIKTLIPSPSKGSACKRFFLFLRWMVRKDDVDLGVWEKIDKRDLIIPLDTHMFKIAKEMNFLKRNTPDLKAAIEITRNFKLISNNDPVKYDFVLTRFGIHPVINKIFKGGASWIIHYG